MPVVWTHPSIHGSRASDFSHRCPPNSYTLPTPLDPRHRISASAYMVSNRRPSKGLMNKSIGKPARQHPRSALELTKE